MWKRCIKKFRIGGLDNKIVRFDKRKQVKANERSQGFVYSVRYFAHW